MDTLQNSGILALVAIAAVAVYLYLQFFGDHRPKYRGRRWRNDLDWGDGGRRSGLDFGDTQPTAIQPGELGDPSNHLRIVMASDYTARKIMNFSEFRVFRITEDVVRGFGHGMRVFSQTALGQVLQSPSELGHRAINSKRVDVLIVAGNGMPVAVLEYQGKGHYRSDAAARDAVKREALRKAGVAYVEIADFVDDDTVRRTVRETLERWQAARQPQPGRNGATGATSPQPRLTEGRATPPAA